MSRFRVEWKEDINMIYVYDFANTVPAFVLSASPEDARALASQLYLTIPARKPVDSGV